MSAALNNFRAKIRNNLLLRQGLAEFLGTFVLVAIGNGAVAQSTLSRGEYGPFSSINWAYGLAVAIGVWVSGGVSGGHINPAVTLAFAIIRKTKWIQVPVYISAQYLGAFLASACIYGVYYEAMDDFDGGVRQVTGPNGTAGIWATYPKDFLSNSAAFGDQTFSTFFLLMAIMAITDENNMKPPKGMIPLCIGLVVTALGMSYGYNCGYALNPARDMGPRLFTLCAEWGTETFSAFDYYFWIPVIGPHIGGIAGVLTYQLFVGLYNETDDENENTYDIPMAGTVVNAGFEKKE